MSTMGGHMPAPSPLLPASLARGLLWTLLGMTLALLLLASAQALRGAHAPAMQLHVQGELRQVSVAALREAVLAAAGDELLDIDLRAMRLALEALPWVERARVSRAWPDTLRVQVWEFEPVARLGATQMLSTSGKVFTVPEADVEAFEALPLLDVKAAHAGEAWRLWQALHAELAGTPLAPAGLHRDARGDWRMLGLAGIELRLGRGDPLRQVARLAPIKAVLAGTQVPGTAAEGVFGQVAYVDLRYGNGFAVGWREGAAPEGD